MLTTPRLSLPYPEPDDPADVPADMHALALVLDALFPAGLLAPFAGAAAPTGWLICDGASLLRATYPALFDALGGASSPWGLADGTHFNVPDYRGRVPVGADPSGVRLANPAKRDRGETGGVERVLLGLTEVGVAGHGHAVGTLAVTGNGNHEHQVQASGSFVTNPGGPANGGVAHNSGSPLSNTQGATHTHGIGGTVANHAGAAASASHDNMPPYAAALWIVKT